MKKILIIFELIVMFFMFIFGKTDKFPVFPYPDDGTTTTTVCEEESTSVEQTEDKNSDTDHEDCPLSFFFTPQTLAEFKHAYETMTEQEFLTFVDETKDVYGIAGINSKEDAKRILDIASSITVVLIDGKPENLREIHMYVDCGMMDTAFLVVEGERHIGFTYESPIGNQDSFPSYDDVENAEFIKEITKGDVTARVFYCRNEYCSEMWVNGTNISTSVWTSTGEQTLEEFEADFARFEFAKMSDLMADIDVSDS